MTYSIDYHISACDEYEALKSIIPYLENFLSNNDRILLTLDSDTTTKEVYNLAKSFKNITLLSYPTYRCIKTHFKEYQKHCINDYIFCLSADERPQEFLLTNIKNVLLDTKKDAIAFPRINIFTDLNEETVKTMYVGHRKQRYLLEEPINKSGWHHWPDYQTRLVKNVDYINYSNNLHGGLVGYKNIIMLPAEEKYALIHTKTVAQQSRSNMCCDKINRS